MGAPIRVTVGPLAAASATKISASQKAAGAQYLVLNGAAGSAVANNICQSQSASGAGNLTINGTAANTNAPVGGAVATYALIPGGPQRIYITSAANDSSVHFTVTGTVFGTNGITGVSETVTGANTSTVSTSKLFSTVTSVATDAATAGNVTVGTNGVATLDTARHVIVTSGGNDTGITFTVSGTDWYGEPISEAITGASGAAAESVLSYATVTSILTSGGVATTVTVGTNTVADSPWVRFDGLGANSQVAIQVDVTGTASTGVTVQQTLNDPNQLTTNYPTNSYAYSAASTHWLNHPDSALVNVTSGSVQGNYAYAPLFARLKLTTTGSASATGTFQQAFLGGT